MEFAFKSADIIPKDDAKGITVADVEAVLAIQQSAVHLLAATNREKDAVAAVFAALETALSSQDPDGQPTVEAMGKVTDDLTDIFIHVVVVPSGTIQQQKLETAASATSTDADSANGVQPVG